MGFFNVKKVYDTPFNKEEFKKKLLLSNIEASGYKYTFEEIEKDVFVAKRKKKESPYVYYNNFLPIIRIIAFDKKTEIQFNMTKLQQTLLVVFGVICCLMEIVALLIVFGQNVSKLLLLEPIGIYLLVLVFFTIGLKFSSKLIKVELEKLLCLKK